MEIIKKNWLIILGVIFLIGAILIIVLLGGVARRGKTFESRPLVLIHDPSFNQKFQVGDGVIIHATAREENGLARIELWVNDRLLDAADAEGPETQNLALFSSWVPSNPGEQQIIVRAISADDVQGQSSLRINVVEADGIAPVHITEEGETLESIAEEYGISPEAIEDLNPGLGADGPAPGDGLILPDDDPEPEDFYSAPESEGDPPEFGGEPAWIDSPFSISDFIPTRDLPILLRVEVPRLDTETAFEGLHCYLGLADHIPQWYPDRDHNQATDESFESRGGGSWSTEGILVGSALPLIIWPDKEPLPATMNCVGITDGGTEAVELGRLEIEIPPVWWTGVRRTFSVDGAGGHLEVDVRISRYNGGSRLTPKILDPSMEVPSNLELYSDSRSFTWDYSAEGEAGILGFQIFLNGNLLWTEEPASRESRMPAEWFRPPCGSAYIFSIRAYRYDAADDEFYESYPAEIGLRPPVGCVRQLQITFQTLETFDLGNDGRYEDRSGDVGPAYGGFYANEARFSFNQRRIGLDHNTLYDLGSVAGRSDWRTSGSNIVYTDLPEGRTLRVGFNIMDRDDNPDDRVCRGVHRPLNDEVVNFDEVFRSTIFSDNRQCEVSFEIRPGPDSPVGVSGDGGEPLPWLDWSGDQYSHYVIEGESRGEITLFIRNTGTAGWSEQDLTIGLFTREGEFIREVTIPDFDLPVGDLATVTHEDLRVPPPHDFCIQLDLYDEVLELHERTGNLTHTIKCPVLPDLEIQDAYFQEPESGTVVVQVQNVGPVEFHDRSLQIEVRDPRGGLLLEETYYSAFDHMGSWESRYFHVAPVSESIRERMADGYYVTINPNRGFVESSYDNNTYTIGPATRLSAYLSVLNVPIPAADILSVHVDGYIYNGRYQDRQVLNFDVNGERLDWDCDEAMGECSEVFYDYEFFEPWFEIYGDEDFAVVVTFEHRGSRAGGASLLDDFTIRNLYEPPGWHAGDIDPETGDCHIDFDRRIGSHAYAARDWAYRRWRMVLDVCRENFTDD